MNSNPSPSLFRKIVTVVLIPALGLPSLSVVAQETSPPVDYRDFCAAHLEPQNSNAPADAIEAELALPETLPAPLPAGQSVEAKRGVPRKATGVKTQTLLSSAKDEQITRFPGFRDPLRPIHTAGKGRSDNEALVATLNQFADDDPQNDLPALRQFVDSHPGSRWTPAALLNLGSMQFDRALFSEAMDSWWQAWELTADSQTGVGRSIADLALAKYARMNARVGRKDRLEEVFEILEDRPLRDEAALVMDRAREGYAMMNFRPEISFMCGPYALERIASLAPEPPSAEWLSEVKSPDSGFSLSEVEEMARKIGLQMRMVKRAPGSPLPEIGVIHWKVGHFGALVGKGADGFIIDDPTFEREIHASRQAMEEESSGYFLVPSGPLPEGWAAVPRREAGQVFGKGFSAETDEDDSRCSDDKAKDNCSQGMATWNFHLLLASLNIEDIPVWHDSPYGPSVPVAVIYNERESAQPSTFTFSNFGKSWVSNWISYVEDDPAQPGGDVAVFLRSGGKDRYPASSYHAASQTYGKHVKTRASLMRTSAHTYERIYEDGSKEIYDQYIGTTGPDRRVFLTEVIDPWGNVVSIEYDQTYPSRISRIYDAAGFYLEFFYEQAGEPYLVTRIADPYSRDAHFEYQLDQGEYRLTEIEDIIGIESEFTYGNNGKIDSLTTPYKRTEFDTDNYFPDEETHHGAIRSVTATEKIGPNYTIVGDKEMVEYNVHVPLNVDQFPDPTKISADQNISQYKNRNSFYWNKLAMRWAEDDWVNRHDYARVYHWLRPGAEDKATGILESVKFPGNPVEVLIDPNDPNSGTQLEIQGDSRIWYNYPNQPEPSIQGSSAKVTKVGRVVEDENGNPVTAVSQTSYNANGMPYILTDPEGRKKRINYKANGIDIASIQALQGSTWRPLVIYTNYVNHRPTKITTPGGVVTNLTLNAQGQVTQSVTSRSGLSITTVYGYNLDGRLETVTVEGTTQATYTYDAMGRVQTATDATGYTLTYGYDNFDRVTSVTHPDGSTTETIYQYLDPVATKDREDRWTHYTWNHRRELTSVVDPKGLLTAYEWCACGSLRRLIDAKGQVTTWTRDLQGRVLEKTLSDGRKYQYTYQPLSGRLANVTYPADVGTGQPTISYAYDLDGQVTLTDYTDPAMADVSYAHNDFLGRLKSMTDGGGTTVYTYRTLANNVIGGGQLGNIKGPWNHDTVVFTYDGLGRPKTRKVKMNNGTTVLQSETYNYDTLGRLESVVDDLGTHTTTFDGDSSRPLSQVTTLPGQSSAFLSTEYAWETTAQGARLAELRNRHGATASTVLSDFTYGYSPAGQIDTWQRTLGHGAGAVTTTWEMIHDPIGQLTALVEKNGGGEVTKAWEWAYDAAGNRISEIEGPAMRLAGIGGANRLDRVGGGGRTLVEGTVDEPATVKVNGEPAQMRPLPGGAGYLYSKEMTLGPGERQLVVEAEDGAANKTLKGYSVTLGGVERTLTHDVNGNLVTEAVAGGKTRSYEWDAINRLTAIQSDVVPVHGTWRSEFTYDGQSRRVQRVEKTWDASGGGSWVVESDHKYLWIGTKICQKRDASGTNIVAKYYANGERLVSGGNTDYHYTRDHLGSIREVVETDGDVYLRYDYTPWGERIKIGGTATTAESDAFEWGFTGHHYHAESGLHLALYRAYDANLGRWLSEDPLGEAGGLNLYGYVGNAPLQKVDLLGLTDLFIGGEGEIALGLAGFNLNLGIVIDLENPMDSGVTGGVGPVCGLSAGAGVGAGLYDEISGTSLGVDVNAASFSGFAEMSAPDHLGPQNTILDIVTDGNVNGFGGSYGPGVGGGLSLTFQESYTLNDLKDDLSSLMDKLNIPTCMRPF